MKKILTSFLSLVLVFIAVLTLAPNVFAADDSDELALNILVYTEELEAVELEIPMTGKLGLKLNLSLENLSTIYEKDTGFFIHNGNKIDGPTHQFTISGSTTVYLILKDAEDVVAVYLDSNTKVLDVQFGTSPVYDGPTPTKAGYEFNKFYPDVETISEDTIFVADYTLVKEDEIEITIHGGTTVQETYLYNDIVTLVPDNEEDFLYWADMDGQVVSSNPNYAFSALVPTELQAVYEGSYQPTLSIYLTNVTGIAEGRQSFLGYINNPEGVEVVEHGLLVSTDVKVLTLSNATKLPSTALVPHTNEFLMSGTAGTYKSFRAYAIYMVEGEQVVVYSDNNFVSSESSITFDFEDRTTNETGYFNTDVVLNSVTWKRNNTRISTDNSFTGWKGLGDYAATFRNGEAYLSTKNPIGGVEQITLLAASYGTDTNRSFNISVSYDEITWFNLSTQNISVTTTLTKYTLDINYSDLSLLDNRITNSSNLYIKIYSTSGGTGSTNNRMLIDNIEFISNLDTKLYSVDFYNGSTKVHSSSVQYNTLADAHELDVEGYTVLGWKDAEGNDFDFNTSIKSHIKLYADLEINKHDVNFDVDGGSEVEPIIDALYNTEINKPSDPTKDGYTFAGWYSDSDKTVAVEWPFIVPDSDTTLYAKWTPINYTIITDEQGGSLVPDITLPYGSSVSAPEVLPTKEGYNFVGWFLDAEGTEPVDFDTLTMPIDGLTIYAVWVDASIKYTVSFELNGGTGTAPDQEITAGNKATIPADPTKDGFKFKGWYVDGELLELFDFETAITHDMTLHAKWVAVYTVTFDTDGGSTVSPITGVEDGSTVSKPEDPTKEGFDFDGWYSDSDKTVAVEWPIIITGNITLYVKWETALTYIHNQFYTVDMRTQNVITSNSYAGNNSVKIFDTTDVDITVNSVAKPTGTAQGLNNTTDPLFFAVNNGTGTSTEKAWILFETSEKIDKIVFKVYVGNNFISLNSKSVLQTWNGSAWVDFINFKSEIKASLTEYTIEISGFDSNYFRLLFAGSGASSNGGQFVVRNVTLYNLVPES